ncbi:hypothetical protein ACHAXT_008061 [Thalassiosira profunda]
MSSAGSQDGGSLPGGRANDEPLDPLDPRRVSLDLFELYCFEMLSAPYEHVGRRAYLVEKMRYMIRRLIGEQYDYGRLYNRTCIANLVARLCGRHAYRIPSQVEEGDKSYHLADCLVEFTPKKWKNVMDQFQRLRGSMLRNDAAVVVYPSELGEDDEEVDDDYTPPETDEEIDEVLASHDDFSKWYNKMLDMMRFHACMSHLQPQLEGALQEGESRSSYPRDAIVAFDAAIDEHFGRGRGQQSLDEIGAICKKNRRMFDLEGFQVKFLQLIRSWVDLVLPEPVLAGSYGSAIAVKEEDRKPMAALSGKENVRATSAATASPQPPRKRQKRGGAKKPPPVETEPEPEFEGGNDALAKKVKDPLDSCVKKAQAANAHPKTDEESESESEESSDDQKKSARALTFTDSSGDEDEEDDDEESESVGKKRRRFTEEEDSAIRLGVERFGEGNWAEIKSYYNVDLMHRTGCSDQGPLEDAAKDGGAELSRLRGYSRCLGGGYSRLHLFGFHQM